MDGEEDTKIDLNQSNGGQSPGGENGSPEAHNLEGVEETKSQRSQRPQSNVGGSQNGGDVSRRSGANEASHREGEEAEEGEENGIQEDGGEEGEEPKEGEGQREEGSRKPSAQSSKKKSNGKAPEKQKDHSKDNRLLWMINKLEESLEKFNLSEMWQPAYYNWLLNFLDTKEHPKLFFWIQGDQLGVSASGPPKFYDLNVDPADFQIVYFLKKKWDQAITFQNIQDSVIVGVVDGDPLDDLLNNMNAEFLPKLLSEKNWPEGVKKEFVAQLHKFMAALTEASHASKGRTTLYIPNEDLSDPEAAAKDKDLLQRLESTVIYWTRQIKEVTSNQDSQQSTESTSPLDEIKHWTSRTANLNILNIQLQKPELKRIINVLDIAGSSYLPGFKELEKKIKAGHEEANDNLQFLNTLAEPCRKIENAEPKDIPKILPEVLNSVRLIWELSKFYNTPERMKGLLTKISNQIIKRCRAKINKDDMLEGDVEKCMQDLDESIACCREWKTICLKIQGLIKKYSSRKGWTLDKDETIFAENEAFIQRCKDLKEICEGQLQFARKSAKITMPVFGGSKGPELTQNLKEIESMFQKHLLNIQKLDYDILDVKITKWHDDYGQVFKENIKNIEIIYQNIIALAFKNISTVPDAIEMLENFDSLAKRPMIKDYVHKKAAEWVYKLFMDEVKEVEEMFEGYSKRPPPMPVSHPKHGGLAIWAQSLIVRIDRAKNAIDTLYFIPEHPYAKEAQEKYTKLRTSLDNFIAGMCYNNWKKEIDMMDTKNIDDKLEVPILVRTENAKHDLPQSLAGNPLFQRSRKNGLLESNFDVVLLKVLVEVTYWTKIQTLGFVTIPHTVSRLLGRREQLRILRENVMLIVRDYNNIIHTISDKERSLFKEHLDLLDRTIEPGIKRFNWGAAADTFVYTCRRECQDVFKKVKKFQKNLLKINDEFEKVQTTTLTSIQKKLYQLKEFIKEQEEGLKVKEKDFTNSYEVIKTKIMKTYELFIQRGPKIQSEWLTFINRLDQKLEKSLKQAVKNSLQDLSKHIRGDLKQEIVPIFKVMSNLDPEDVNWRIFHDPTHDELKICISSFIKKICLVTKIIPRVEKVFREEREKRIAQFKKELDEAEKSGGGAGGPGRFGRGAAGGMRNPGDVNYQNMSEEEKDAEWNKRWQLPKPYEAKPEYEQRISNNKSINNVSQQIIEGIENIQQIIEDDRKHWQASDEFRQLYNIRSDRGRKRILLGSKDALDPDPVQKYKESIESLNDVLNDIKNKHSQKPEQFIILDCSKLKYTLLEQGNKFIQQLFEHLIQESKEDLSSLLDEFVSTIEELKTPSTELSHLKKNKDKYNEVRNKLPFLEARRDPIKKKFQYILDQEQDISLNTLTEEDKNKLALLDDAWNKFRDGLEEANLIIQKSYAQLKTEMDHTIDDFKKEVQENKKNFQNQAPYSVDKNIDNQKAKEKLHEFKQITKELREKEEEMKFGLEIFDIEPMAYPELSIVEKEIALLTEIWNVKEQWDGEWNKWKQEKFYELNIDMMDDRAVEFQEMIKGFDKEVRQWGVYEYLKNKIDNFRSAMPLIMDLRDEAMRERHWKELRFEVKDDFDETAEDFTLEKVFDLQLNNHAEKISELADNARKELKIEVQLKEIKRMWEDDPQTDLDIIKMKSKANNEEYYKIQSTENLYQVIEDHVVKLSNMKSSPYYKQFDDKIDSWENNIAQITETLELLIAVQGKWSYLESIFRGQQDISKQLPSESSIFQKINNDFKIEMERINKERNAYKSLIVKGFIQILQELNRKLEHIQKNLNQFLEGKRGLFPRFYFLSNDDLLEIIGQAKDPEPIQKHIKKIFEGINSLKFNQQGRGQNKQFEITTLVSPEKEEVEIKQVIVDARVEQWLKALMEAMKEALRKIFYKFYQENMGSSKKLPEREKLLKIIRATQGQVLITCAQMQWTNEVLYALQQLEQTGQVNALKKARQTYKKKVENYVELVEKSGLTLLERLKLISLITIEEHNREIIERLYSQKIQSPRHFEWLQQLRFKRGNDENEQLYIQIDQTNCTFDYGYEYQGNNGRLVVTPLTDRAYMTLTNALNMQRGGAPQGPAGTGKTETVKDLGKNLAFFVVIQNCSDSMDYISLGKTFAGLALSGSWGCFDEFNRIELEVLSVVAQQIQTILDAIKKGESQTAFQEMTIQVQKDCGIFITMNPGYAGRTELPDNLKSLFRPVAMMVPDFNTIAKIILMSEGFKKNEDLAKKVVTIYELMKKQLSKQDHYDFGMRAVKSVLSAAGRVKRERPDCDEFTVMIKAIRDMNLPKFLAEDVVLFDNLFIDLFPGCDEPENDCDDLLIAIEDSLKKKNLQLNENLVVKILQLYESKVTRHGNMLVGVTMSGKTTCWEILADALNVLNAEEREKNVKPEDCKYPAVKWEAINPKSITINELFGYFDDANPPQWHDGVLSSVLKRICQEAKNDHRWMILDGPVDTLWIESMNSVLDDNKLLTLNNGDRIGLSPNVRLLFEIENLAVASPATVSRAGMIYMDIDELGWKPFVDQWIAGKQQGQEFQDLLEELINKYVPKVLKVKKTQCTELVATSESSCVMNLCKLFDALCKNIKKADDEDQDTYFLYIEKWFVFCLIWSIGATVEEQSRREIDYILRDIESMFPHSNTVYEHYINTEKKDWASWEEKLQANWKPVDKEFHKINVPTIDTVRNRYIVQSLLDYGAQVLLVGHSGVGKTVLIEGILLTLDAHVHYFTINFSAGTSSENTQEIIESNFERRAKNKYRPKNAKQKAVCFIDDLNMPRKDTYGSQPPLELIRQWMDYEFWYDRQKIQQNQICDLQILSAMGKPGGGRAEISKRLQSKFHIVNYTIPTETQMKKIFETIALFKFQIFDEDVKNLSEPLAVSTINLFNIIQENFLPTPAKSHYLFNMRDISKVFQGIYLADKNFYEGKEHIIKLWAHEILRVFHDRLNSQDDRDQFKNFLNDQLQQHFQMDYKEHCQTNGEDAVYVDFLNENMKVYEEVTNFEKLRDYLIDQLENYNSQPKLIKMDLVLFKDAITHIAKIYRVLNLKRGHCFLVGVGGSGRHSLTRLSAFISEMNVFQLEVTKGFAIRQFRDFIKGMYEVAAYKGKNKLKSVFIFSDNDVVHESFLEDVNNMLSAGVVPNLYLADELAKIREEIRRPYKQAGGTLDTPDALNDFFFSRVKDNLHISICMSPIGQAFRDFCRMYPALINNTTINWFMKWPDEALTEVAMKFVGQMDLLQEHKSGLAKLCSFAHSTCIGAAGLMEKELKRIFYVTPTNYIELLKGYNTILSLKRKEVGNQISKLRNGLQKLDDARKQVEEMTQESEIKRAEVSKQQKICEDLMITMSKEQRNADESQKKIEGEKVKIEKEKEDTEKLAAEAEAELKKAEPALIAANEALESLDKKYIAEIKSFASPPVDVATVMSSVMIVLGKDPTWASVKKELADPKFVDKIMNFDKDNIGPKTLKAIEKYTKQENFQPNYVKDKSMAAGALCMWVRSLEDYAKALKVVGPKREKKAYAEEQLRKKVEYLQKLEDEYKELADKLAELDANYKITMENMQAYKKELDDLQTKIDRGDKLITGLSGEKTRWEASLIELDDQYEKLVGDCILAAAFMSYCGPFPSEYRENLTNNWISTVELEKLPYTPGFDFSEFLAGAAMAREWQMNGLPTDKFSFENGVLVTRGLRWALNVDPQSQANNWIKRMEGESLVIADFKDTNYIKKIEMGIVQGKQVLFQDVEQEIDPVLDNVLNKSIIQIGKKMIIKIGGNDIEYHKNFKLYITTRMSNPHYTPEVSTKVCLVNFTVKESGLEEQCLGIVVKKEQPNLEQTKNDVVSRIANNKKMLIELEDKILRMLSESKVNLLEDVTLISTLQTSKETSDEVKQNLEQAEQTMKRIDDTRETYRPCGKVASILFFVLNDLNRIDPMYQFSLDWYKMLFQKSIEDSKEQGYGDRIKNILKTHTLAVYKQACRSLFEKHKLLLSLQMCVKLKMAEGEINEDEWTFFLRGGQVMDRSAQPPKPPFDWITPTCWDNITELEKILPETFAGISNAITLNPKEWQRWYLSSRPEPENAPLPGEWETKCEDRLKKMIVLRCLRQDRVIFAVRNFVEFYMKKEFVENKPTQLQEVYDESQPQTPIIFVLSPGVDPTDQLKKFAEKMNQKIESISLGKGQSEKAKRILTEGADKGNWVFLANCHLSISLLPELESIIDLVFKQHNDPNFRLFMSASPHPKFPISLLQRSLKVTQEPPKGIKANMLRLYDNMGSFQEVDRDKDFRKVVYGLCWFHSILIERKKFKTLGWNVSYAFNDSDYQVCEDLLAIYLGRLKDGKPADTYDKRAPIPWQAIQYLIAEANYGGRITDDRDRRLIKVYAKEIFNENLITAEKWKPPQTDDLSYGYPADEQNAKHPDQAALFTPDFFYDEILNKMEPIDNPIAFGQHINAEITSQKTDSLELLESILSLQPQKVSADGESREDKVLKLITELTENIPQQVDVAALKYKFRNDDNPLTVVLIQELQRYNILLNVLLSTLDQLEKGIKGLVVISPELEQVMQAFFENKVPKKWAFAYFSLKPLAIWIRDLNERYKFFETWSLKSAPFVFNIAAFTYPTGFTTSLLQRYSRKAGMPSIDKLEFDFIPLIKAAKDISEHAKDGAFIGGLYLEGAKWNMDKQCLMEPEVMELTSPMPVLHFKPISKRSKPPQNMYECPCYYYPIREGTIDKDSFMLKIDLKTGDQVPEFWIKRGTALLIALLSCILSQDTSNSTVVEQPPATNSQSNLTQPSEITSTESNTSATYDQSQTSTSNQKDRVWGDFYLGLTQSFIVLFFAEIGDRTFIFVTLMVPYMNAMLLFLTSFLAMSVMQVISVVIGALFAYLIPQYIVSIIVICLFGGFGVMLLYQAYKGKEDEDDSDSDREEIEEEIRKMEGLRESSEPLLDNERSGKVQQLNLKGKRSRSQGQKWYQKSMFLFVLFSLMCQEWGDTTQISSISLSASYGMMGIIIGGCLGYLFCIIIAIGLGSLVDKYCNQRFILLFTGLTFLVLAGLEIFRFASN